jgi:hypothetical protein
MLEFTKIRLEFMAACERSSRHLVDELATARETNLLLDSFRGGGELRDGTMDAAVVQWADIACRTRGLTNG